jgi:hypothetical protein
VHYILRAALDGFRVKVIVVLQLRVHRSERQRLEVIVAEVLYLNILLGMRDVRHKPFDFEES